MRFSRQLWKQKNLNFSNIKYSLAAVLLSNLLIHLERIQNHKDQPALA